MDNAKNEAVNNIPEDRRAILSEIGYSEEEITYWEQNEIPEYVENYIDKAMQAKSFLQDKYDIEFRVRKVYNNVYLLSSNYEMRCYAKEGALEGKEFSVIIEDESIKEAYCTLLSVAELENELNEKFGNENYKIVLLPESLFASYTYFVDDALIKEATLPVRLCFRDGLLFEDIASLGELVDTYLKENGYKTEVIVYRDIPDVVFNKLLPWWDYDIMNKYT